MRTQKLIIISFLLFLSIFAHSVFGQLWSKNNLYGGPVSTLAKDSNGTLYVGSYSGTIFLSDDNGESWEKLTDQLDYKWISSILLNKRGDIFVSATTGGGGVYKSTNNGLSWAILENGLKRGNAYYYIYTLSMNQKGHLFAAGEGIFRSEDNGDSWEEITNGLAGQYQIYIRSMAINSQGHIFIVNGFNGVYRSEDNGNSWEYLGFKSIDISCIEISSQGDIFLGTGGIYRSVDNGNSWEHINTKIDDKGIRSILITPDNDIYISSYYQSDSGNVFLSKNYGESWTVLEKDFKNYIINSFCYNEEKILAATLYKGMIYYSPQLDKWEGASTGLFNEIIFSISENENGSLYSTGYGGVYRKDKDSDQWTNISYNLDPQVYISVIIDSEGNVYASHNRELYRLNENDSTWARIFHSYPSNSLNNIYLAQNDDIFVGKSYDLYRSVDHGNSFNKINRTPFSSFIRAVNVDINYNIYIGTQDGYIYKSENSGRTWDRFSKNVYKVDGIISNSKGVTFLVSSEAIFKINNNETDIIKLRSIPSDINTKNAIKLNNQDDLFVSFNDGLIISKDDGESWQNFSSGLTHIKIKTMFVDNNGFLWLGSDGNGLWKSSITTHLKYKNTHFEIGKNYPNPFNGKTVIPIRIYSSGNINLSVFNTLGQKVNNLFSGFLDIGYYEFEWDGKRSDNSSTSSGIYFYQLTGNEGSVKSGKVVYVK